MLRLIGLGLLAGLFFSSTFVLNRAMSLAAGHWFWTASLRFGWMLLFLCGGLLLAGRASTLRATFSAFRTNWLFWTLTGSIGFGGFYSLISFSAAYAPGWVIATTWQTTILASPLILLLFGRPVPIKAALFILMIFCGIMLVNLDQFTAAGWLEILLGGLPVLLAAFAYPFGNQLLWEAQRGSKSWLPHINSPLLEDAFIRILLLSIGTIPYWLLLFLLTSPPPPTAGQLVNTALVALFSGVIATSLFLQARHGAKDAYEIAAIDATQSSEVLFSLLGEIIFLQAVLPGGQGFMGVILTLVGLAFYIQAQAPKNH